MALFVVAGVCVCVCLKTGPHYFDKAGLELMSSSNPLTLPSQVAETIGTSHASLCVVFVCVVLGFELRWGLHLEPLHQPFL
jgi:hypothetical protein